MRKIDRIIVHCTATPEGRDVDVGQIDAWHKARGWNGIGYHYVIYLDGSIHEGRPIEKSGAHCKGQNKNSIGVCYVGGLSQDNKPKDTRTPEQKKSLIQLLKLLKKQYPEVTIHGHREFAAKACPCFDAKYEYRDL